MIHFFYLQGHWPQGPTLQSFPASGSFPMSRLCTDNSSESTGILSFQSPEWFRTYTQLLKLIQSVRWAKRSLQSLCLLHPSLRFLALLRQASWVLNGRAFKHQPLVLHHNTLNCCESNPGKGPRSWKCFPSWGELVQSTVDMEPTCKWQQTDHNNNENKNVNYIIY